MKNKSKLVTSDQKHIHPDLEAIIARHKHFEFKKPLENSSIKAFDLFLNKLDQHLNKKTIFDLGCGTGESTFYLSQKYPDHLIVGVDKSESRLSRHKAFKKDPPRNLIFLQCELIDFWLLAHRHRTQFELTKQYLLYPNPWPKQKLVKKRFHAHPLFETILSLAAEFELRTNWKIYAEEFVFALKLYGWEGSEVENYHPQEFITNFEKKYFLSEHQLYKVQVKKREA
ncbi:MAG: SAM-dependent methyltransferase [Halobacteriovoraceae bacterium]|nr:SAM-dependent methyltransferase [Halobacteriovoraceae bacterium]|tara:strand:+ start:13866 stop:14546 length:681 start_codon:yes stop_codon:yes gene_type:complete